MLPCHPAVIPAGIINFLQVVKFPDNVAVIVDFQQIYTVLHAVIRVAVAGKPHHIAARQHFRRHGLHIPAADFVAVHIKQQDTVINQRNQSISVPAFFRIINRDPVWKNKWLTHYKFLLSIDFAEIICICKL